MNAKSSRFSTLSKVISDCHIIGGKTKILIIFLTSLILFSVLNCTRSVVITNANEREKSEGKTTTEKPSTERLIEAGQKAWISKEGGRVSFKGAELIIPPGALEDSTEIQILYVEKSNLPALDSGMINLTRDEGGFRLLPAGQKFAKRVWINIPLDSSRTQEMLGFKLWSFYWDESRSRWRSIDQSRLDKQNMRLVSTTKHFSLVIGAVLETPQLTGPSNFDENTIKDIEAVAPTANVDLIQPPEANNKGDARLTFPIRLPKGRGAFSPTISLTYSSSNGNGPLGIGWGLPISKIEIDTRWGVPRYDGWERFSLDGLALVPVEQSPYSRAHSGVIENEYAARIHNFDRILLCRNSDGSRHWEVTKKDGTRFEYGIDNESRLSSYHPGELAHIGKWYLRKVVDINGNITNYHYEADSESEVSHYIGDEGFIQKYLSSIEYTSHTTLTTLKSVYRADFIWNYEARPDPIVSGRLGFKTVTRGRLESIEVKVRDSGDDTNWLPIRTYVLEYIEGALFKTVLNSVKVFGSEGSAFYEHTFDYTEPEYIETGDNIHPFASAVTWPVATPSHEPPRKRLQRTSEKGHIFSISAGGAFGYGSGDAGGECYVGGSLGFNLEYPDPELKLLDVNGDGVVDRIWLTDDGVLLVLGQIDNNPADNDFGSDVPSPKQKAFNLPNVGKESSIGGSLGITANCDIGAFTVRGLNVHGGLDFSVRYTAARSILSDVDGDGLIDLLIGNSYYPGLPNKCRDGSDDSTPVPLVSPLSPYFAKCNSDGLLIGHGVVGAIYFGPAVPYNIDTPADLSESLIADVSTNSLSNSMTQKLALKPINKDNRKIADKVDIPSNHEKLKTDQSVTPPVVKSKMNVWHNENRTLGELKSKDEDRLEKLLSGSLYSVNPLTTEANIETNKFKAEINDSQTISTELDYDKNYLLAALGNFYTMDMNASIPLFDEIPEETTSINKASENMEENTWGFNTSARRRMSKESDLVNEFYRLDPVLRWDIAHTGEVRINGLFRRKHVGGRDGVNVYFLYVEDYKNADGTTLITQKHLNSDDTDWVAVANDTLISVEFGHSILFVFDTIDDVPFALDGTPLDEVEADINFVYESICRPKMACRPIALAELEHRGPTGQLEYVFNFKKDFRISELPRQSYWILMPPLGPSYIDESGRAFSNRITGVIKKLTETETPVHIRIRCESMDSKIGTDDSVCPLGTILAEHVFEAAEIGETLLTVDIPEPFSPLGGTLKVFKPIRLMFEIDGENGFEVPPDVITWSPQIEIISIRDLEEIVNDGVLLPDLVVDSLTLSPEIPTTNDEITFVAVVRNIGRRQSDTSVLEYRVGGETVGKMFDIPPLRPDETFTLQRKQTLERVANYRNNITIDIHNENEELDETNNKRIVNYSIVSPSHYVNPVGLPDLIVESVSHAPESPTIMEQIIFTATVRNVGNMQADPSVVEFIIADESRGQMFDIPILSPGQSFIVQRQEVIGIGNNYTNKVIADVNNNVRESNEENNQKRDWYRVIKPTTHKILVASDSTKYFITEKPMIHKPPVLYRVHPLRQLVPFIVTKPSTLEIKATIVNPKHPLFVTVTSDQVEGEISQFKILPEDVRPGNSAVTKKKVINLNDPGTYYVRGYTEASFDPSTSFNLEAELVQMDTTNFVALIHNEEDTGLLYPGATPPIPTNAITSYLELNSPEITLAVIKDTETEEVARKIAPDANIIVIKKDEPYVFSPLITIVPLSSTQAQIVSSEFDPITVSYEELTRVLVRKGWVTATLIEAYEDDSMIPLIPAWEPGAYACCTPWFEKIEDFFCEPIGAGGPHPAERGKGTCYLFRIIFIERDTVDVNLLTADYGTGYDPLYELSGLTGEVAHSLDPYGGGHHGFFYGVFNGEEALECIGPFPCTDRRSSIKKKGTSSFRLPEDDEVTLNGPAEEYQLASLHYISMLPDGDPTVVDVVGTGGDEEEECLDTDGDGICPDDCPDDPEDFDGYEDEDGCPDGCQGNDIDSDGVSDCDDGTPFWRDPTNDLCADDGNTRIECIKRIARRHEGLIPGSSSEGGYGGDNGDHMKSNDRRVWISPNGIHSSNKGAEMNMGFLGGIRRTWTFGLTTYMGAGIDLGEFFNFPRIAGSGLGLGFSAGIGISYTDRDVMDWNGDGLIDLHSPNSIIMPAIDTDLTINSACHNHDDLLGCLVFPSIREQINTTIGFTLYGGGKGSFVQKTDPSGGIKYQGRSGVTFGQGVQANHSSTLSNRIDVNGDGLPDFVFGTFDLVDPNKIVPKVRLNLGYRLGGFEYMGKRASPSSSTLTGIPDKIASSVNSLAGKIGGLVLFKARHGRLEESDNITFTKSVGGSVGAMAGIFGGSVSGSHSKNATTGQTSAEFVDINGDGLVDFIQKYPDESEFNIQLNTGFLPSLSVSAEHSSFKKLKGQALASNWQSDPAIRKFGFMERIFGYPWIQSVVNTPPDVLVASGSKIENWTGSASVTLFGARVGADYQYNSGGSHVQLTMMDVDGDGLPDRVLRTGNEAGRSAIQVQRNLLGGANLLKTVHRPLGGKISLSYERRLPTEDDPNSRWLLKTSTLTHDDFVPASQQTQEISKTFEYEDSYRDRYEKEGFGFKTVKTTRADGQVKETVYENRDYWLQGQVRFQRIFDPSGAKLTELENLYESTRFGDASSERSDCISKLILPASRLTNGTLEPAGLTPCDARFPMLTTSITRYFEGGSEAQELTKFFEEYDDFGNVTRIREVYGPEPQDQIYAIIQYDDRSTFLDAHIVDRIQRIEVRDESPTGTFLRIREAEYNDKGNITRHKEWAKEDGSKVASLEYTNIDQTGFVRTIKDANGYQITYTPDDFANIMSTTTTDNFGLESRIEAIDFRFQEPTQLADANGQMLRKSYDEFGRISKIWGPYETEEATPSLSVQYSALNGIFPAKATTTNNAIKPGTTELHTSLRVARFVDGLGREIQVQTDTEVNRVVGRAVSGKLKFDASGRRIQAGEPEFRSGTGMTFESMSLAPPTRLTQWQYDALNRPTVETKPGDITTTWNYDISEHPRMPGMKTRRTQITDPASKMKYLHTDAADRRVAVVEMLGSSELETTYDYNRAGDLVRVVDANNNERNYEYDLAGQLTALWTAETGRMEYEYDNMGNLVAQTDQVLCDAAGSLLENCDDTQKIRLVYDKNRLILIDYPDTPDVQYVYGDEPGLTDCIGSNTQGRICKVIDGGGIELRSYGALGELIEVTRNIQAEPWRTVERTFTNGYSYDSFGRLLTLRYPDRDSVYYDYDVGGRVKRVHGKISSASPNYVADIQYDVYGKATRIEYGNGVVTTNAYEPDTRRLDIQTICGSAADCPSTASPAMKVLDFGYDNVGNVLSITEHRNGSGVLFEDLSRNYTYDDLHRLDTYSINATPNAADGTELLQITGDHDYDVVGNLERQQVVFAHGDGTGRRETIRDWTYEYTDGTKPNLPQIIGPYEFNYDTRGAMTRKAKVGSVFEPPMVHRWDDAIRLKESQPEGVDNVTRYLYNDLNQRVQKKTVNTTGGGSLTGESKVYPSQYYVANFRRVPTSGATFSDGSTRTKLIQIDGQTIAAIINTVEPSSAMDAEHELTYLSRSTHFLHADLVKSTTAVTSAAGAANEHYEYLPFGEAVSAASTASSGGTLSFAAFNGKELDVETGLLYFGERYYDPVLARWTRPDALPLKTPQKSRDIPQGLNLFTFVRNNPVVLHDKLGFEPDEPEFQIDPPGWDPNVVPEDFKWKGKPGSKPGGEGNYWSDKRKQSRSPDLEHPPPEGPHWDVRQRGVKGKIRVHPDTGRPIESEKKGNKSSESPAKIGTVEKIALVAGVAGSIILILIPEPTTTAAGSAALVVILP